MSVQITRKYFCYICGNEVIFKPGQCTTNKTGKIVAKRFNTDGTEHICPQTSQKDTHQSSQRQKSKNANYRDFGSQPQMMKKRQEEQYEKRRKAREEAYKKYRERYTSYYSHKSMSPLEALQILQLAKEVLALEFNKKIIAINRAFWKLALRFHPARRHISPEADEEKFRKIKDAYDSLFT